MKNEKQYWIPTPCGSAGPFKSRRKAGKAVYQVDKSYETWCLHQMAGLDASKKDLRRSIQHLTIPEVMERDRREAESDFYFSN